MTINGIGHGTFVPQGWKLEYTGVGAGEAWARSIELAQRAESLGYDDIWVYDHVETVPRREATHMFEAFTMLAALSQVTERVELGQLVTCVGYRNVGLLAKEAACIDVYSGGRFVLGLGAGWYDREYLAYGYEYPSNRDRLALLDEALEVIPRLWSEETVDHKGAHLTFDGALLRPEAVALAAATDPHRRWRREGDAAHRGPTRRPHELAGRASRASCASPSSWPATATRSAVIRRRSSAPTVPTAASSSRRPTWPAGSTSPTVATSGARPTTTTYVADNLVGTVEQVTEKAQAFVDAGCGGFVNWYRDFPSDESMTVWIEQVAPALRRP